MRKENQNKAIQSTYTLMVYIYIHIYIYRYIVIHEKPKDPNKTQKYHYTTIPQKTTNASQNNND